MAVVGEKKNGQNERLTFERIPQTCSVQSISNSVNFADGKKHTALIRHGRAAFIYKHCVPGLCPPIHNSRSLLVMSGIMTFFFGIILEPCLGGF